MAWRLAVNATKVIEKCVPKFNLNTVTKRQFGSALVSARPIINNVKCIKIPITVQSRSIFSMVQKQNCSKNIVHVGSTLPYFNIISRTVKTKKAAAKRFIKTGRGGLKYGKAGKRHLTSHMTKTRKRRLNNKVRVRVRVRVRVIVRIKVRVRERVRLRIMTGVRVRIRVSVRVRVKNPFDITHD
jgi:large subunit ribosomal protein L35